MFTFYRLEDPTFHESADCWKLSPKNLDENLTAKRELPKYWQKEGFKGVCQHRWTIYQKCRHHANEHLYICIHLRQAAVEGKLATSLWSSIRQTSSLHWRVNDFNWLTNSICTYGATHHHLRDKYNFFPPTERRMRLKAGGQGTEPTKTLPFLGSAKLLYRRSAQFTFWEVPLKLNWYFSWWVSSTANKPPYLAGVRSTSQLHSSSFLDYNSSLWTAPTAAFETTASH